MSWEQEKPVYIEKLRKITDGIDKILALKGNRIVTPDMAVQLRKLREDAARMLPKLEKDEFEIAVVGQESSGKSTFTNALIGCIAVPSDQERCTYTSTCIRSSDVDKAEVTFFTAAEFEEAFQGQLNILNEKAGAEIFDTRLLTPGNLSVENFKAILEGHEGAARMTGDEQFSKCADEVASILSNWDSLRLYLHPSPETISYSGEDLKGDGFRNFIRSPGHAIAVKQIVIYSTGLSDMRNAIMYDVPGFNSPNRMHAEQTLERMKRADAIIMVAKGDEPSITGDVLGIFRSSDMDGECLGDKLFVFANKADRSPNVEKSRDLLLKDWVGRGIMNQADAKERIVLGSAGAHIFQSKELFEDLSTDEQRAAKDAYNGLRERPGLTSGIVELRDKLICYYQETRSAVLKRRVDRIPSAVQEIFRDVDARFARPVASRTESNTLALSTYRALKDHLCVKLEDLKNEMNRQIHDTKPLSASLRAYIEEHVDQNSGDCVVGEDMVERVHRQIAGIGQAPQPQKVDDSIREEKFRLLYSQFSGSVLSSASAQRSEVRRGIMDIFMSEVDETLDKASREHLRDEFAALCGMGGDQDDEYYQSLVERFSRDVFEILVKFNRVDRLKKFKEDASNFFSLGVFYSASMAEGRGDGLGYMSVAPEESPLWQLLLYPASADAPESDAVMKRIRDLTGLAAKAESLLPLVQTLIFAHGPSVLTVVDAAFKGFQRSGTDSAILSAVKDLLSDSVAQADNPSSLLREIMAPNSDRYQKDVAKLHAGYDYGKVRSEFAEDVEALRKILLNAFIPAVDLDKAFSARETKLIEDIIDLVRHDRESRFERFVSENLHLIARSRDAALAQAEDQARLDVAVMNEIRNVLAGIG